MIASLFVGNHQRTEFQPAWHWLDKHTRVQQAADVAVAAEFLAPLDCFPQLVVLAQSRPDDYSRNDLEGLRRLAPLTRFLVLSGSWCEGEVQSAKPWAGSYRVPWHRWQTHMSDELAQAADGKCPAWGLPLTFSDDERLLLKSAEPTSGRSGLVVVRSRCHQATSALSEALRLVRYATFQSNDDEPIPVQGTAAAIYDVGGALVHEQTELRALVQQIEPAPVIVLLNFPRCDDLALAVANGAASVIAKPLILEDLLGELNRLTRAREAAAARQPAA